MDDEKRYKWLVEVDVPERWVKAGFDFRDGTCQDVAKAVVPFAFRDQVQVRVVRGPDLIDLRQVQLKAEPPTTAAPEVPPVAAAQSPPSTGFKPPVRLVAQT